MRTLMWVLLPGLLILSGCAALDWAFGVDPVTGQDKPGPAPVETGSGLLSTLFPWAVAAGSALTNIYQELRKRRYYAALKSTVSGVEAVFDRDGDGNITKAELETTLSQQHQKDGVQPLVQAVLDVLKK